MSVACQILALILIVGAWYCRQSPARKKLTAPCTLLAIGLFAVSFPVDHYEDEKASAAIVQRADRHSQLYGQCLGLSTCKILSGSKKILVITPPVDDNNSARLKATESGLRQAVQGKAELSFAAINNPKLSASGRGVTWLDIKSVLDRNPAADTVILLLAFPELFSSEQISTGLNELKSGRPIQPRLVSASLYADPLAVPLDNQDLNLLVLMNPREMSSDIPADDQDAIAKRFIVLHKDNLEEMDKKFPELNIYDHNPQP
jgi:hypothetical protein